MFKKLINENKDWGGLTWAKLMEGGPERGEGAGRNTHLDTSTNIQIQACKCWIPIICEMEKEEMGWRAILPFFQ